MIYKVVVIMSKVMILSFSDGEEEFCQRMLRIVTRILENVTMNFRHT
jgi:hypothetical protein